MQREDFNVREPVLVRWQDMDAFGHVNNARFFTFCESARIRYFEAIDLDSFRPDPGLGPVLVSATCNFLQQVHYPAELEAYARAVETGRSSFTLEYGIFRRDSEVKVADGSSVVVWIDYQAGKAVRLPAGLKAKILAFDSLSG
jgi:acyl-CoA thioester hydrolase